MQELDSAQKLTWWRSDLIVATIAYNFTLGLGLLIVIHILANGLDLFVLSEAIVLVGLFCGVVILNAFLYRSRQKIINWVERRNFLQKAYASFLKPRDFPIKDSIYAGTLSDSQRMFARSLLIDLIRIPVITIFVALISTELASVMSIMMLVLVVLMLYQGSKIRHTFQDHQEQAKQIDTIQRECLRNYQTIKLLGMENLILRRYEGHCYNKGFNVNSSTLLGLTIQDAYLIWQTIFLVSVIMFLGRAYAQAHLALDQVILVLLMMACLLSPLQTVLNHWSDIISYYVSDARQVLTKIKKRTSVEDVHIDGSVTLQDISFAYPNLKTSVLVSANLIIHPKTLVTIYGQSGSGKTTLAKLIKHDLSPDSGRILFGDKRIDEGTKHSIQDQIAYLSSDPQLYVGTILENLTSFRIGPLIEEAIKLSERMGLDHWVKTQNLGYQTPIVNSMDVTIPSGIKQRIGLIRCLLQEPKILILDEANSYLDDPGDLALKTILTEMKEGMTIIFITHRPSFKKVADDSYDLINGQLLPSMNVESQTEHVFQTSCVSYAAGEI
jgi:ATP-binding cassette subfamily C protein LapB